MVMTRKAIQASLLATVSAVVLIGILLNGISYQTATGKVEFGMRFNIDNMRVHFFNGGKEPLVMNGVKHRAYTLRLMPFQFYYIRQDRTNEPDTPELLR